MSFVEGVVYSRLNSIGISWIEISGVSEEWNRIIEEVFFSKNLGKDKQLVYKLKNEISVSGGNIEIIMQVDKNTFDLKISNIDFLRLVSENTTLCSDAWKSYDTFAREKN